MIQVKAGDELTNPVTGERGVVRVAPEDRFAGMSAYATIML
jgi:hypothetical protein